MHSCICLSDPHAIRAEMSYAWNMCPSQAGTRLDNPGDQMVAETGNIGSPCTASMSREDLRRVRNTVVGGEAL